MTSSWVKYVDRNFLSIKSSLINRLRTAVPELTDYSPSNLLIIIIDMFSGVAEMLNYYIDITARELFLPTARRFSSVLKMAQLAGYLGKARVPAQATVEFTLASGQVAPTSFTIISGLVLTSSGNVEWVLTRNVVFREGFFKAIGYVSQFTQVKGYTLGVSEGSPNQSYLLPQDYAHNSVDLSVGTEYWGRVDALGFYGPSDKVFIVGIKPDGGVYVQFGDGVNGMIPQDSLTIKTDYKSTLGVSGEVAENKIQTIPIPPESLPPGVTLSVTNPGRSFGARNIEGIEEVRKSIPISLRTLDRAVTRQDYIDVATQAPGVRSAVLEFNCGLGVRFYIVPFGGGVPNQAFLDEVKAFIENKSIASIPITTLPSGETRIKIEMNITGRYRISATTIQSKVLQALESMYSPSDTYINQSIRTSDIIAKVDNLPEVDYLSLVYIYGVPYLRPSNLSLELDYNITILPNLSQEATWGLVYVESTTSFTLFRNGSQVAMGLGVGSHNNLGSVLNLEIGSIPSGINNADYWDFKTYPYNKDILLSDYTIPVIKPSDVILNISEQYVR